MKVPEKALFHFVSEFEAENRRFYLICTTFKVGNFVFDCVELELNFAELSTFQKKTDELPICLIHELETLDNNEV